MKDINSQDWRCLLQKKGVIVSNLLFLLSNLLFFPETSSIFSLCLLESYLHLWKTGKKKAMWNTRCTTRSASESFRSSSWWMLSWALPLEVAQDIQRWCHLCQQCQLCCCLAQRSPCARSFPHHWHFSLAGRSPAAARHLLLPGHGNVSLFFG